MLQAGAIVFGAAIIAAAILFVFRWEVAGTAQLPLRLDRWHGYVNACNADPNDTIRATANRTGLALNCESEG